MTDVPWLTVLWVAPLVGAAIVWMLPSARPALAKSVAFVFTLAVLGTAVGLAVNFDPQGPRYQFTESQSWIPAFGAGYTLGLDGIGLALVGLTTVLLPLLVLAGWHDTGRAATASATPQEQPRPESDPDARPRSGTRTYLALMLIVEAMVLLSFVALDVLLFYVFFEAMLVPMYFLIGGFGGGRRRAHAALKFLLYNLLGGLIMLAAVIGLYVVTASNGSPFVSGTFDLPQIVAAVSDGRLVIDPGVAKALFGGFMFAFAVKAPLWPLHTWLPDAAVEATPATGVLMMCVVDKVGTFGMLRYCVQLFPGPSAYFAPLIITLSVIGIIYGALLAIGQRDVMRLIAYTSISHFGFIVLGIFVMTSQGQSGSALYMVNHGISTAALFLIAGFLVTRRGTRLIDRYGGVQKVAPLLAGTFLIAGLATLSLPGLSPFISEFLVLIGTFTRYHAAAVITVVVIVLAALYILWMYQRMMGGPVRPGNEKIKDLVPRELAVAVPLIAILVVFGVYPKPLLDVINPAVQDTLTVMHRHDPGPTVTANGESPGTSGERTGGRP